MLNTAKPFTTIYSGDPAIDTKRMSESEMLAYLHDRDLSKVPIKQGDHAALFHLRAISHERLADIVDTCTTDGARCIRAFRASVIRVEQCRFESGSRGSWTPADVDAGMTPDEARMFTMAEILDIGGVAWARSFLGANNVRRFVPQPLLLAHLAALPFRSAEPSDAPQSKSADSSTPASTAPAEGAPVALSDSPTVAPATAANNHQGA